jgi:hydrogenase expression/formation protein HypC
MCLGIPGQVVQIVDADQQLAKIDVNGIRRTISVRLLGIENLAVGDWVLVHVGFALAKIDPHEADETLRAIQRLGQPYEDELAAFTTTTI